MSAASGARTNRWAADDGAVAEQVPQKRLDVVRAVRPPEIEQHDRNSPRAIGATLGRHGHGSPVTLRTTASIWAIGVSGRTP